MCFRAARLGSCFHRYHKSFGFLMRIHYNHVSVHIRIGYAQAEQRYCLYFGQIELGYARIQALWHGDIIGQHNHLLHFGGTYVN